jgi:hypothetical protein
MAAPERKYGNRRERVAAALTRGLSVRKAAERWRVLLPTVARRSAHPVFKARVAQLRTGYMAGAAGRVAVSAARAGRALRSLLDSFDANVRLKAVLKVLQLAGKVRESADLCGRLVEFEGLMARKGIKG